MFVFAATWCFSHVDTTREVFAPALDLASMCLWITICFDLLSTSITLWGIATSSACALWLDRPWRWGSQVFLSIIRHSDRFFKVNTNHNVVKMDFYCESLHIRIPLTQKFTCFDLKHAGPLSGPTMLVLCCLCRAFQFPAFGNIRKFLTKFRTRVVTIHWGPVLPCQKNCFNLTFWVLISVFHAQKHHEIWKNHPFQEGCSTCFVAFSLRFRLTDVLVLRRGGLAAPQAAALLTWGACAAAQAVLSAIAAVSEADGGGWRWQGEFIYVSWRVFFFFDVTNNLKVFFMICNI